MLGAASAPAAAAPLHAAQIDADNVRSLQVGGPHSIAGIGDWAFGNGVLCGAVTKIGRPGRFSLRGGTLVDLGHCGRRDDQFVVLHPMLNLDRGVSPPFDTLTAQVGESEARIRVTGASEGLRYERSYVLDEREPHRLLIETRVTRTASGGSLLAWGDLAMHPSGSLRPFLVTVGAPERSSGFAHPGSEGESLQARISGIAQGDLHVMVGGDTLEPTISYGVHLAAARLERAGREPSRLPHFAIVSDDFGLMNVLARKPMLGGGGAVGLVQLAQLPFLNLRADETLRLETRIYVSDRADAASITDFVYRDAPRVSGRVDDPGARVHVSTADGDPVTEVRPDASGAFAFRALPGSYMLRAIAPGGRVLERSLAIGDAVAEVDAGLLELGAPARLELRAEGPMRVVFVGIDGTRDPALFDDLLGVRVGAREPPGAMQANSVSLAGVAGDPTVVTVAPGRYRVIATRGPEYELVEVQVDARAGEPQVLTLEAPARAIDTAGWIAADLHVHSAASFDSGLPYLERVRSFAAQGGEVLVATEHDRVFDLAPSIGELGLEASMASVVGVESTSVLHSEAAPHTFGHANVLPMPYRPDLYRGGAPVSQGVRLREMIDEVRALPGTRLVQLNHPRGSDGGVWDGSFFTHLSVAGQPFEPTLPLDAEPNRALLERDPASGVRDLDYDAVELLNGETGLDLGYYQRVRADWFSLMLQGEVRTGTANSDSHRLASPVGVPRTYVPQEDDRPEAFDEGAFIAALREGRAFGTTGPFLEVDLGGVGIGGRFTGRSGTLSVRVRSASWAQADRARAFVNGRQIDESRLDANGAAQWALDFESDSFVTVEVEGERGEGFSAVLPRSVPFAFANPIFVDADGDGKWTAPGLPRDLPSTLSGPQPTP